MVNVENGFQIASRREFMMNANPASLGLEDEATGVKGVLKRIKETVKRIFSAPRFTVIYECDNDRKKARSAINDVVGWTPFKRIEYINLNEYLSNKDKYSFNDKRILFVSVTQGMQEEFDGLEVDSAVDGIRKIANSARKCNFCYYYQYNDFDNDNEEFETITSDLLVNSQYFCPKICYKEKCTKKRQEYAEYFRLVGKRFLKLN